MRRASVVLLVLSIAFAFGAAQASLLAAAADPLAAVTVSSHTATKPTFEFKKPFAVQKTVDEVVTPGRGEKLATGQSVTVDYVIVDGRTGTEIESSWGTSPQALVLDKKKTTPQLVASLVGLKVGSRVLLAMAPKVGLAAQLSARGVKKNDTLLFAIDVKSARTPLARAKGEAVAPVTGLPTVKLAAKGKPTITVPDGVAAPTQLVAQPLIKGSGPAVQSGQTVTVHYTGVIWATGKQFDSSWDRGKPLSTTIGTGSVIAGWDEGLVGQTVGSQVLLVIPPDKGYGSGGQSSAGIKGTDTLVFVVDVLDAN